MSALGSDDEQNSEGESLRWQTDRPTGSNDLSSLSGTLCVDGQLKFSNEDFKQLIESRFDKKLTLIRKLQKKLAFPAPHLLPQRAFKPNSYFSTGVLDPLSQLIKTPPFPTPHVMAQLAYKAYTDYKKEETDAQYEKRLELPDGWKLLTTASNSSYANGYFGAAYWHPEHQQVVIAHRGTDPTNVGALWADVKGVVYNQYVGQMESASTFAHEVIEVLKTVNQRKGAHFQLFFTGHSLGGWLAQITTFTTKYLKIQNDTLLKSDNIRQSYHPHTVVFDSPGCQDMLLQMTDKFDVRLDGRSIDLEHLDITSYLSAPNRINTCNSHLGTVYRIFIEMSDMRWWHKKTILFTIATHRMEKIVQAFDPKTGQVYKDEQGQLKLQVVVDWPISAGVSGDEEYQSFFEWAKDLNNYHPDNKEVTFEVKGYHPLRYQTKTYDERVCRLSVFGQEELLFLESYLWLRQLPEIFKPKKLFSVMGDNQAQEKAEEILKGFAIAKDKIRCEIGSPLQTLVPYVKRLLQLFPEIKENTKLALSSDVVRNRVYQIETRRYVERISHSPIDVKPEALVLREFIEDKQQQVLQLQMVNVDEWTGLIKVYQVLQKSGCLIEGQYTVLTLNRFLTINSLVDFTALMQSTETPQLLLMACEDSQLLDDKEKDIFITLFNTIKEKPFIKIILTTRSEGNTYRLLQQIGREIFGEEFVARNEQLTWSDITSRSQEMLLNRPVKFQGGFISLNKIVSAESPAANFLPLGALLEGKELTIADPVQISDGYNKSYYIERTFNRQMTIKEDIFREESVKERHVYLANTEQEFQQLCQFYPSSTVHWLGRNSSGKLVWQQSQGSLESLRKYIDTGSSHTYRPDDLDILLKKAEHQSVMVISDTAGMGKSTVLTHLSNQIKQTFPAKWVVRIDLNDHTDVLKVLKQEQIDMEKKIEFVSERMLKLKRGLEMELFKQCCEQNQKVRIILMLDGFDEISPFYKEPVFGLMETLRKTAIEQLWVTTRPHLRNELEDKLQQISYTLEPFSEENQVEMLTKFWGLNDWVTEPQVKDAETGKSRLEIYAERLVTKLAQSIRDTDRKLTGIPLQTRMLAEAFEEEVKIFCQSEQSMPQLEFKLDILDLYGRFMERKYNIYQEEKFKAPIHNVIVVEQRERDSKIMRRDHQLLALMVLFTEEQAALFHNNDKYTFTVDQLTRFGIVQVSHEGKPHFIHRSFAEYYVANFFVNNTSQKVQEFMLKDIFLKEEYQVIRVFIDCLFSRSKPSKELLIQYGTLIDELGNDCLLQKSALEGNANIIKFMLESARAGGHTDKVIGLLLGGDEDKRTALHLAALSGELEVLELISVWAKENLKREELKKKFFLAKDRDENTASHLAALRGIQDSLKKIWDLVKDNLTAEEIQYMLFLDTDRDGDTSWHLAPLWGEQDVLQRICDLAKEILTAGEIKNMWFLAKDSYGNTAWHLAAKEGNQDVLQKICDFAKDNLTAEEIENMMFLATDRYGNTAWYLAAKEGNQDVLQKICHFAKENLTPEKIKNTLFLATDRYGKTAWQFAAKWGNEDVLQKLCDLAKDNLTPEEIKNALFLAADNHGNTAWHLAAEEGNKGVLQKIFDFAKDNLTAEEIKNSFFLATDRYGHTAWHFTAMLGNQDVLQKLCDLAKDNLTAEEIKHKLFLATDRYGNTAWHLAAEKGNQDVLQKIYDFAKDKLTVEEIKHLLFLTTDRYGNTAWHLAAKEGNQDVLQKIYDFAKDNLTPEELKNTMALATDRYGDTAWHFAAEKGNQDLLKDMCDFARYNLTAGGKEYNSLPTEKYGYTDWHLAAEKGNQDVLQVICDLPEDNLIGEEIKDMLFLATDTDGNTGWHLAAKEGNQDVFQKICNLAKDNLTEGEIKNMLLLATDRYGNTAWHLAAKGVNQDVLQKIYDLAKENLTAEEIKSRMFLATDSYGKTAWHLAVKKGNVDVLQKIYNLAKDNLTAEEIKNMLFLATDRYGNTALNLAPFSGDQEILHMFCDLAKENLTAEDIKYLLFSPIGRKRFSVWYFAAKVANKDVLQKVYDLAKDNLRAEEIKILFLAADSDGFTAWHMAVEEGNEGVLRKICDFAKDNITAEEIKSMLFSVTDRYGSTTWHLAVRRGNEDVLQKICDFAEDNLTAEEIKNMLFLAPDSDGNTAWCLAVKWGNIDVLQKIYNLAKNYLTAEEIKRFLFLATDRHGNTARHLAAKSFNRNVLQKISDLAKDYLTEEEIKYMLL